MNHLNYQLYLFDLDDTLINTSQAFFKAIRAAYQIAQQYVSEERYEDILRELVGAFGTTPHELYWQAFALEVTGEYRQDHPLGISLAKEYEKEYWKHLTTLPYALEYLKFLKDHQKKIGIITNGLLDFQHQKVKHTGLSDLFSTESIFCSDQFLPLEKKPAPTMIHKMIQNFHSERSEVLFFGNANVDVIASKMENIDVITVEEIPNPKQLNLLISTKNISSYQELLPQI